MAALFFMGLFFTVSALSAETVVSAELEVINSFVKFEQNWLYVIGGSAGFSVESTGNRNVKGELKLRLNNTSANIYGIGFPSSFNDGGQQTLGVATISTLNFDALIEKLFIKARFPFLRFTIGKTRLSWGEGVVFNAGDVIFGSDDVNVDLTAEVLRSETAWLTAFYFPVGNFSFIETVFLSPPISANMRIEQSAAGLRFYATPGVWKTEFGYLYSGRRDGRASPPQTATSTGNGENDGYGEGWHKPYVSFKFNALADVALSSSLTIPHNAANNSDNNEGAWRETWKITPSVFYSFNLPSDHSLNLRIESLFAPYGRWSSSSSFRDKRDALTGEVTEEGATPGVLLYPELIWDTGTTAVALGISSLISPLDASAKTAVFASWGVLQGLTLIANVSVEIGDSASLFNFNRRGGVAIGFGARYKY